MGRLAVAAVLTAALAAAAAAAVGAAPAAADTAWLCRPGVAGPCGGSLETTVVTPDRRPTGVVRTPKRRQPVDCFYVYPTVSEQPTAIADLSIDPELRSIAHYQAGRFASVCRVFAPVYRQMTLAALAGAVPITAADREVGYRDVRAAWREYLRRHNRGRGVVLIGHSQGTFMLRRLIRDEIDRRPAVRRRLVSALLLGGNVVVARGRDRGGDFRHVPACRRPAQVGCVIAYSTYAEPVPETAVFVRPSSAFLPLPLPTEELEVLCTNPAALGGGTGRLDGLLPTAPFGGVIGMSIAAMQGPTPDLPTPWVASPRAYAARCADTPGGGRALIVAPVDGAPALTAVPDPSWGLHLADVNIALGNLTRLVAAQSRAYRAQQR